MGTRLWMLISLHMKWSLETKENMKATIKESIPQTAEGLEIFIKECHKEIKRFSKLQEMARQSLNIKTEKTSNYGINKN